MNDTANASHRLEIHLLGKFAVIYKGDLVPELNTPRLQSLLAYLALHSDTPQSRKSFAFLLWPDSNEEQALTNLRKQVKFLRDALPDADQLLVGDRQTIGWVDPTAIRCDVTEFRTLLSTRVTTDHSIVTLKRAIELYKGELLPGCYDEWLLPVREELQHLYLAALERLSTLLEGDRKYDDAIQTSQQLLRIDPLHEATYRRLIRLYALNEDRASALRTYHTCVTQLREELGIDPDEETQALYERLLNGASVTTVPTEMAAHAPFVGRQQEWQTIQKRWRLATPNQPQFVLIAGEAGIGKTRLAEELLSWAHHQGFCTIRSRCYAAEGRLTYAPIIEWLRSEPLYRQRSKVASTWLTELARLLPEMLSENPTIPAPEPITQSAQRHHLFEAVSRALLASEQPLLLLIDDLQWCDKESLELLHFLLRNASTLRQTKLLLIGTARLPDEVDLNHPLYELLNPLRGSDSLTQIDLARLSVSETSELATQMAERQLDDHALKQLFADTAGNPLFVVETMRASGSKLSDNGDQNGSAIPYIEVGEELLRQLPPKVLAVIQSRLAQLSAAAQELCEWAAIIGRAFTLDLLVSASKMAQDKAVNALDELWQRRILREQGSDAYDFSHDRIRDVASAGVSRVRRRYLHRCVAETLETQATNQLDNLAAQIASHFEAAGMVEKAIHHYVQAAQEAGRVYANDGTVAYLQRAIGLLRALPESVERDQRELSLLVTLGPSFIDITNFTIAHMRNIYERAYHLSQQLCQPLPPIMLRIWAIHHTAQLRFAEALEMGQQLLKLAQTQYGATNRVVYLEGCYVVGVSKFWQGHFSQARSCLQEVVDTYPAIQQAHHLIEHNQDTGIYCRTRLGWTLWYLGYPDRARQECEKSIELAQRLGHPYTLHLALTFSLMCFQILRDRERSDALIRLREIHLGASAIQKDTVFGYFYGCASLLHRIIDDAIAKLEEYAALRRTSGNVGTVYPYALERLADAYLQAARINDGLAILSEAFSVVADTHDYVHIAEIHRIKGELLVGRGDYTYAEACFLQALEISRRQQAKSFELRSAMSMARLWDQQGKRSEARELLTGVYNWFTEGFDTADLREAKALLELLA